MSSSHRSPARLLVVLALMLLAASCGSSASDTDAAATDETTTTTTTTDAADETTTTVADEAAAADTTEYPSRIVSLSATATEMLFAIGAGDQVIAADSYSNYPAEAPTTELSSFEPNLEAIAAEEPDLVVFSFDPGELATGLESVGIDAMFLPAAVALDDVYAQIADLGVATGHEDEAAAVVADMRTRIDEIVAGVAAEGEPIRIYHELDDTFYSASSNAFIGQLYALFETTNIADEADADGYGYPQLNPEYILEADPQLIVITDQVAYTPDDVAARPGWDAISAVQSGSVVVVDADIASRWGPRLPDFLESIAAALAKVPVTAGS
ncbi:MAG: ABC transporter substrate-binding protein [Acidimicrobiales bacterium]